MQEVVDLPASIDIIIPNDSNVLIFVFLVKLTLMMKKFDVAVASELKSLVCDYLLVSGDPSKILEIAKASLSVNIHIRNKEIASKRGGADRKYDFEKRLDLYATDDKFTPGIIDALDAALERAGYPGKRGMNFPQMPDGRRANTSIAMLIDAIRTLKDPVTVKDCMSKIEMIATQIWGWKYAVLTPEWRAKIMEDFTKKQTQLVMATGNVSAGCPNLTIRMLIHFEAVGFPYTKEMFKLPMNDTWMKNISKLETR
jgi:hypothetical protein